MNPFTGSLKYLSANLYNSLLALVFYLLLARYLTPIYLGEIALIQLLASLITSVLAVMPTNLIMREVSHDLTAGRGLAVAEVSLIFPAIIAPALLIFVFFPKYVLISLPYFFLTIYTFYQQAVLSGMGKFNEANIGLIISSSFRYGLAVIGIIFRNIDLIILFWTLGALASLIYYSEKIRVKPRWHFKEFKAVALAGLPIYLNGVISFISSQGDRVVTYALLGAYFFGIYQLAAMISTVPPIMINSISYAILPASTFYYVKGKSITQMSSLTFRLYAIISLPLALIGYALSYPVILKLFPQYVLGARPLELLILFLTATMPFQSLSIFIITAKKSYIPFLIIGSASAIEVVGASYVLIPRLNVLGAAIAQSLNAVLTSALFVYFSVRQNVFVLDRKNLLASALIAIALMGFLGTYTWAIALIAIIVGIKLTGILDKEDVKTVASFAPPQLKRVVGLLAVLAS